MSLKSLGFSTFLPELSSTFLTIRYSKRTSSNSSSVPISKSSKWSRSRIMIFLASRLSISHEMSVITSAGSSSFSSSFSFALSACSFFSSGVSSSSVSFAVSLISSFLTAGSSSYESTSGTFDTNSSITSCSSLSLRSGSWSPGPFCWPSKFYKSLTTILFWWTIWSSGSSTHMSIDLVLDIIRTFPFASEWCLPMLLGFGSFGLSTSPSFLSEIGV